MDGAPVHRERKRIVKKETRQKREALKDARRKLEKASDDAVKNHGGEETREYLEANAAVIKAEKDLPWILRG